MIMEGLKRQLYYRSMAHLRKRAKERWSIIIFFDLK